MEATSEQGQTVCCAAFGSDGMPSMAALPLRERLAASARLMEASTAAQRAPLAAQAPGLHGAPQAYFSSGGQAAAAAPARHGPVAGAFGGHALMGRSAPAGPQMVTSVPVLPGRGTAGTALAQTPAERPGARSISALKLHALPRTKQCGWPASAIWE